MRFDKLKTFGALLVLPVLLAACSGPGYYLQAASGHWRLMRDRQEVAAILADPASDPELVGRLATATEILGFAETQLALPAQGSYSDYVATGRSAVAWNVVATPEFSLAPKRWCFAVAGCVPYRGFFELESARKSADRLAGKGMDTTVSPVAAYSTLGWFRDPLLDTMLEHSGAQLAATLIHELAHQRLYVKSRTEFSESYARFVERAGVERWLRESGRDAELARWQSLQQAAGQFNALLLNTRAKLSSVYDSDLPDTAMRKAKRQAFRHLQDAYRALVLGPWRGRDFYAGWFAPEPNNASLALVHAYEGGYCAFAALFQEAGGDFGEFHRLAATRSKLAESRLDAWLSQSCDAIAPRPDL